MRSLTVPLLLFVLACGGQATADPDASLTPLGDANASVDAPIAPDAELLAPDAALLPPDAALPPPDAALPPPDAALPPPDAALPPPDARPDARPPDARVPDARVFDARLPDAPPSCTTDEAAGWLPSQSDFIDATGAVLLHDFETRGDGTPVTAGVVVPEDEYLACCGFKVRLVDAPGATPGKLLWAGNPITGYSVRAVGTSDLDVYVRAVEFELVGTASGAGARYTGGTTATVYDADGDLISTEVVTGSGLHFLGYSSAVPIKRIRYADTGGEDVLELRVKLCP